MLRQSSWLIVLANYNSYMPWLSSLHSNSFTHALLYWSYYNIFSYRFYCSCYLQASIACTVHIFPKYDTIIMTVLSFVTKIHMCHSICGLPACLQSWLVKPLLLFWEKGHQHKKKSAVWPAASQRYNHGQLFHQTSYYATMLENINYTLITQIEELY